MRRGTTPLIVLELPDDISASDVDVAYMTMQVGGETIIEKALADMSVDATLNTLAYKFTQDETLSFVAGTLVKYQWRFRIGPDAYATQVYQVPAEVILKDGII